MAQLLTLRQATKRLETHQAAVQRWLDAIDMHTPISEAAGKSTQEAIRDLLQSVMKNRPVAFIQAIKYSNDHEEKLERVRFLLRNDQNMKDAYQKYIGQADRVWKYVNNTNDWLGNTRTTLGKNELILKHTLSFIDTKYTSWENYLKKSSQAVPLESLSTMTRAMKALGRSAKVVREVKGRRSTQSMRRISTSMKLNYMLFVKYVSDFEGDPEIMKLIGIKSFIREVDALKDEILRAVNVADTYIALYTG